MRLSERLHFTYHLSHSYQEDKDAFLLGILAHHSLPTCQILQLEPLLLPARPQLPEGGITILEDFQEMFHVMTSIVSLAWTELCLLGQADHLPQGSSIWNILH